MDARNRKLLALAALALLSVYVLPLWHITLNAPQYPEGLGMYIRIGTVEGQSAGNLDSINRLNHYIGMKPIEPDAIPELRILPWVFAGLIVAGVAAAAAGKKWMLYAWVALFGLVMAGSLIDFYRWGYDYGHNLDAEHAIIEVPGMTYQPPLIGTKQMLNIRASSWPALGGCIAGLSLAAGCALVWVEARRPRGNHAEGETARNGHRKHAAVRAAALPSALVLLPTLLLLGGCTPRPEPIRYGSANCAHCRMTISDQRFGAELVTTTGKVYSFDSIECLAAFYQASDDTKEKTHSLWVTDYRNPPRLIRTSDAAFIQNPDLHSPMGGHLAATSLAEDDAASADMNGRLLLWKAVLALANPSHGQQAATTPASSVQ